ncbi:MAG: membrane protein of unknown function [Promethearchaeota archaeon]|nr:MAG: membrane protein of unknown function [Candidatus Lokiarchaeota archaeon]
MRVILYMYSIILPSRQDLIEILIVISTLLIGILLHYIFKRQIIRLEEKEKIQDSTANKLRTLNTFIISLMVFLILMFELITYFRPVLDQIWNFLENDPLGQRVFQIIIIVLTLGIGILFYYFIKKQIKRQTEKERIDESTAKNLETLNKIIIILILFIILTVEILIAVGPEDFGIWGTALATATGTVLGFAGINSLGNFIAGIIVMTSRPFVVGDRINFKGRIADVIDIKLIYTVLEDIDGVRISIPNQNLLKEDIENYGRRKILRREVFITAGFGEDPRHVETALLEAAEKFGNILKFPEPRVDVYEFLDFAVKYRLIVFINNSRLIPKFDHDLRKAVYYSCRDYKVDLTMPTMIQQFQVPESFKKTSPPPKE